MNMSLRSAPVRTHEADGRGALLLFHGLRSSAASLDAEARAFAAAGVTTFAVDAPHHGARRSVVLETMPDTGTLEGRATLLRILREARDEIPQLVDEVLALGYEKVGVAGVSMGAFIALAAAVIEPRLSVIVSILGSPDWTPFSDDPVPDSPHLSPQAFRPRPLLFVNGARDVNVPPEPARRFVAQLRPLYRDGVSLEHREYDVDHFARPLVWREMVDAAVAFTSRALTMH
jgi:alpha-beta hydrolase superfamily lysophospholipase